MRCINLSVSTLAVLVLTGSTVFAQGSDPRGRYAPEYMYGGNIASVAAHEAPPSHVPSGMATATPMESVCQGQPAAAPSQLGAQVFFRGGISWLSSSRGNEVFTDTLSAGGLRNDKKSGASFGFGFHLPLMKDPFFGQTLLADVLMNYSRFSNQNVITTTSALIGAPAVNSVPVTQFVVSGSPKLRIDCFDRFRPWLIPVGMAMLVNSPPTNNTTYLDIGLQFGVGADYRLTQNISIGVDCRYFYNLNRPDNNWLTSGVYLGFDF